MESPSPPTDELLRRIWNAVEPAKPKRDLKVACAIILSLATTASAWCAYPSKLWGGAQMGRANAAVRASREAAVKNLAALQARSFDACAFITYMQARLETNQPMASFLEHRLRPDMKPALDASVLCFLGIARAFESRVLRQALTALPVVLSLATLAGLLTMPTCHE